jgi:hypothetical protein
MATTKKTPEKEPKEVLSLPDAKTSLSLDLEGIDLDPKKIKFVALYTTNGFNEIAALKDAGYFVPKSSGPNGPQATANTILRDPGVIEALKRYVDASLAPYRAKLELEITQIYYRRATYKLTTFFTARGNPKPLNLIPDEWLCCIDGTTKKLYGGQAQEERQEYILPNRDQALQMLYRMVKGVSPEESPESTLLPGEVRHKLRAYWEGKDLNGVVSRAEGIFSKTIPSEKARRENAGVRRLKDVTPKPTPANKATAVKAPSSRSSASSPKPGKSTGEV